jgi:hypothetical protein
MGTREIRKLAWMTGLNGYTIVGVAALATVASLFIGPTLLAVSTGLAITGAGLLEVGGHIKLRKGEIQGIRWAQLSQLGVLLVLVCYSLIQLSSLDPSTILTKISPETQSLLMGLYQIDEPILADLLVIVGQATYMAVILAATIYQGGLYWYYGRKWRRSRQSVAGGD